jgi:hypothetical protein
MVLWPLFRWHAPFYQGYTSRFPGYISKATKLLVSESGASRQKNTRREQISFWTFGLGVKGIILTIHMPKNIFLGGIEFRKCRKCSTNFSIELPQCVEP